MTQYIKNFEPEGSASLTLAAIIVPVGLGVYVIENLSGLPLALAGLAVVTTFVIMMGISSLPNERAHANYRSYLRALPVEPLAMAVNDPDKPEYTRTLIRQHLDTAYPGWHIDVFYARKQQGIPQDAQMQGTSI